MQKMTAWQHGLILALMLLMSGVSAQEQNWALEKQDDDNRIRVYTRINADSPLKEFRGVMQVQSRLTALVALIEDHHRAPDWIHQCRAIDIIERHNHEEILFYMVTAAPWPVKDRDSVVHSLLQQDPDTYTVRIDMQVRNDIFPISDDMVRISNMQGFWQFRPLAEGWVEVTYQVHADPGGGIPGWLINSLVVDTPYYTLRNMQKLVQEPRYQQVSLPHVRNRPDHSL